MQFIFKSISQLLFVLMLLGAANCATAESRHALVIGNSNYGSGFDLVNPRNDAMAVAEKLGTMGYSVHGGEALLDLNLEDLNDEIDGFLQSVEDGSSVLFYYAGHGSASENVNYLIPILPAGVKLRTESDVRNRSVSIESILERARTSNPSGVNVFLIDACRDAPIESYSRSINLTGLTALDSRRQPRGSFIGFSTEYGRVAEDGVGSGYSPFAAAVLNNLDSRASVPIELFYKGVSEEVYRATKGKQYPIQEPKIRGEYCLVPCELNTSSRQDSTPEIGYFDLVTKPADAELCFQVEGEWDGWSCGRNIALPVGKPVSVRVSAKKHKTRVETLVLERTGQKLLVELQPQGRNVLKIVGVVSAAVLAGVLLSNRDSGSEDTYTITLNPPSQ